MQRKIGRYREKQIQKKRQRERKRERKKEKEIHRETDMLLNLDIKTGS